MRIVGTTKIKRILSYITSWIRSAFERKLGRVVEHFGGLTVDTTKITRLIDERVRDEGQGGRIAPHLLKVKVGWATFSKASPEAVRDMESEILAVAIEHINNRFLKTLAPVTIVRDVDVFASGISVEPSFGELEEQLAQQQKTDRRALVGVHAGSPLAVSALKIVARITGPDGAREKRLSFKSGKRRLYIGRAVDSDLRLEDESVSKVHATMALNREGLLLLADTGSARGTSVNERRLTADEARQIKDGDVITFGEVKVRIRKIDH